MKHAEWIGRAVGGVIIVGLIAVAILGVISRLAKKPPPAPPSPLSQLSQPRDPLAHLDSEYVIACADGTFYTAVEDGAIWLVKGKATRIRIDDDLSFGVSVYADPYGGVYMCGKNHLWYFRNGVASRVEEVPSPGEQAVTQNTLMWSVRRTYGMEAFNAGHETGYESGREAGRESVYLGE